MSRSAEAGSHHSHVAHATHAAHATHSAHAAHATAVMRITVASGFFLLGGLGDEGLGGQEQARDRRGVLKGQCE